MYHCNIQFYYIGEQRDIWDFVMAIPPLERFTHTFFDSAAPDAALVSRADVIFADLRGADTEQLLRALQGKKEDAELILLAGREQSALLPEGALELAADLWLVPMEEREVRFRAARLLQEYKKGKDLWQAGHFLQASIDGSPNLIWFKDKDGTHEMVNDSFCRTVNKTKQQVQGRGHAYIWNVEHDDPACIESEEEVMRRRTTCVAEETIQTGDGTRVLTTYKSPLYDVDGSVMGTVGVGVDVTQERAYEREIIGKNRTLEMLFATMDCGVMCHSLDGRSLISINRAALRLLGYDSQEEMLQDGFDMVAESVLDEDKPVLRDGIKSLKRVGDAVSVEYRVRHKDGKMLYILGNVKLIEEDGELLYQRFLLDFTPQKIREQKQWEQKDQEIQYQEQVFEIFSSYLSSNIDDVYMMFNASVDEIEFVSSNVERVLGISWEKLKKDIRLLGRVRYVSGRVYTPEELEMLEPSMSLDAFETERINPKTGEHRWFRESVYCVLLQNTRKFIYYISDRTKERITQNTLTEALEIAQVANKAKSAFLSNVSHDIRTPMNAIMGYVALLRGETNNPDRVREYTQKIFTASQHMLGLINDVLDMNKIEGGGMVLNISEMDLAEIIDEINTVIRPQARAKNQKFEVFTSNLTCERLMGDRLRISQVLNNILNNAVKYTQPGGRIEMRVTQLPQVDNRYSRIRFTVSDNGRGMSEEFQKVVFDPFTREQNTTVNKIQGTGLGMAIAKSLVDLMNGSIKVTSQPGEGSTFEVELELGIQEREEDLAFWKERGIHRMIVVDDDEQTCRDIVRQMERAGVDADYSLSGIMAVETIRSAWESDRPYDLILLNWKMPDLNGLEAVRQIRRSYPLRRPILLYTAQDWEEIREEAQEVGLDRFLPKPFFMTGLRDAVSRAASRKKPVVELGAAVKDLIRGTRILVVDDNDINRIILVKLLGTLGADCDIAENGQKALEKFEVSQPGAWDIILMDVQMPGMDGYDTTRAIRSSAHPDAKKVSIVAVTNSIFGDEVRDALQAGMDAYISKPVMLEQMKSTLQFVMEQKEKQSGS